MRILVVEDDSVLAAALTRALNQSAYAVDLVGDGEAANEALATTSYDLVCPGSTVSPYCVGSATAACRRRC